MSWMFDHSQFNQDISNWDVRKISKKYNMFTCCPIRNEYKPKPYNKKKVNEGFDFDSVSKEKKSINVFSIICQLLKTPYNELTSADKKLLKSQKKHLPTIKVDSREELKDLILRAKKLFGYNCNLNWIDVSNVTDMSYLFSGSDDACTAFDIVEEDLLENNNDFDTFNGDISKWDVSNVTDMSFMFYKSYFNGDISNWNVSNVTDMSGMFKFCDFNGDISKWNVSNVTNMEQMFNHSKFNGDINNWNISNVTTMREMFYFSDFNKDISKWRIDSKCEITYIFDMCDINNDYKPKMLRMNEGFDFGSVKNNNPINVYDKVILPNIFSKIKNNQSISQDEYKLLIRDIAIYKVRDTKELLNIIDNFSKQFGNKCNLNWIDTTAITNMNSLFSFTEFDGDISKWNVRNVKDMECMFT
jgi:surface protein